MGSGMIPEFLLLGQLVQKEDADAARSLLQGKTNKLQQAPLREPPTPNSKRSPSYVPKFTREGAAKSKGFLCSIDEEKEEAPAEPEPARCSSRCDLSLRGLFRPCFGFMGQHRWWSTKIKVNTQSLLSDLVKISHLYHILPFLWGPSGENCLMILPY